jgi:hypothetical protein
MGLINADAFIQFLKDSAKEQKYENLKIDVPIEYFDI